MKKEIYGEEEKEEKNGEKNEVNYMQNDLRHALRFNIREGQGRKRLELWFWAHKGEREEKLFLCHRSIYQFPSSLCLANISLCERRLLLLSRLRQIGKFTHKPQPEIRQVRTRFFNFSFS